MSKEIPESSSSEHPTQLDPEVAPTKEQSLIHQRYWIEKELGRGGIGIVYLARDVQLHNRPVVMKVLQEVREEEWIQKKFRQEMEALARIEHPGVVGIFDAGEMPDGKLFIVMQFVEGVTLRSVMKEGPMDFHRASRIIDQVGRALSAAHDKGVFHCDLKPDNIMIQTVDQDEIVKLIDFGIAKIRESNVASSEPTRVAGTLEYMAPEQFEGTSSASSDIFALGIISYEMLTGQKPFSARSLVHLLESHRSGVSTTPRALRPTLPPAAEAAILKALAYRQEDRFQKAREFSEYLAKALTSNTVESIAPSGKSRRPAKTTAIILATVLTTIAVVAFLADSLFLNEKQTSRSPDPASFVQPPRPVVSVPELMLHYSIEVQKYRDGQPYGNPFVLAKEINFEKDYRIRLQVAVPQAGHLYILNEGPLPSGGVPLYNLLYPSAQDGSSKMEMFQKVYIPEKGWFIFDEEEGTEKLWLIYAKSPLADLEKSRTFSNPQDKGEIKDRLLATAIRKLLLEAAKPRLERNSEQSATIMRATGNVLAGQLQLEHH